MYSFAALQFSTTRAGCIPRFGFAEHNPLDQAGTVENMKNLHDLMKDLLVQSTFSICYKLGLKVSTLYDFLIPTELQGC